MNDTRSFMIVMFGLTTFLCFMVGRSVHMVYNHTGPPPAETYRESIPAVPIPAVIDQVGYEYVGTCRFLERDDGGHGDSFCDSGSHDTNRLCRPVLHQRFPQPETTSATVRRLSDEMSEDEVDEDAMEVVDDETDGNFSTAEARRLRGHGHGHSTSCYNKYAPWLRVNFTVGGVAMQRCSYRYGTKANSQTLSWNYVRDEQENRVPGQNLNVFTSNITGNCVVVFENITIFQTHIDAFTHQKEKIVPLYWLFFIGAVVAFLQMLKWMFYMDDPPEGEDAKKSKDAEEESEEEEEESE